MRSMDDLNDRKQRQRANWEASRLAAIADAVDRVRFQASLAEKFLNALLIAHGGAIIGLFTFIGNLLGKVEAPLSLGIGYVWGAFASFVVGLSLTLGVYLMAFLSQHHFYHQAVHEAERFDRAIVMDETQIDRSREQLSNASGDRHYRRGLLVAGASVVLFIVGGGLALMGLLPR